MRARRTCKQCGDLGPRGRRVQSASARSAYGLVDKDSVAFFVNTRTPKGNQLASPPGGSAVLFLARTLRPVSVVFLYIALFAWGWLRWDWR